ncbi:ABC-2 transporter permease [Lacicoccus qingdaonensis]|uniref:ABC-2 type transport system permease protein n=1 Tax=Lacicoccus qingdaonensis TaxID=576118 RepID=A0A1G9HRU2_9BACL|nr:ABC-2 transporter permease [Salinicoccus qingdaonensis]SDL15727.1 ABC-2 type transport system permease protein [Salinicoccus qingdaonensis]
MLYFLKRDLILQKKLLWLYVPFILIFVFTWSSPFLIFTVAALYIPYNALAYDEQVNSDKLLNSLPYTRLEITLYRYLGTLVYTAVSILLVSMILMLFDKPFTVYDIGIGVSFFLLIASFTYPLFQIFKQGNITTIIIVAFVLSIGLLSTLSEYLDDFSNAIANSAIDQSLLFTVLILSVLIIYFISWFITYSIYRTKDF